MGFEHTSTGKSRRFLALPARLPTTSLYTRGLLKNWLSSRASGYVDERCNKQRGCMKRGIGGVSVAPVQFW